MFEEKQNRQKSIAHSQLGHVGAMLIQWWILFETYFSIVSAIPMIESLVAFK